MVQFRTDQDGLHLSGPIILDSVQATERSIREYLDTASIKDCQLNLREVDELDTAGAVLLHRLPNIAREYGKQLELRPLPSQLQTFFEFVTVPRVETVPQSMPPGFLENTGEQVLQVRDRATTFLYLMSDLTVASFEALFDRTGVRPGSFVDQAIAIGSQALPIVALILFLIGAVSSLQSAAQLRQFGAHLFVADLLAIGMCRELGPLMTAIIVSGRSGSAIAAEVATMKFTEELDALKTMGLNPLRFVAVPKMWAMLVCVPLLTILADFVGILGGVIVAVTSLEVSPGAFVTRAVEALILKDVLTGLVKSVSFAWIITTIGVYQGLDTSGGATGVGRSTTASVVASIFGIILLDCFWGIVFYMKF